MPFSIPKQQKWVKGPRSNYNPTGGYREVITFKALANRDLTFDYKPLNDILTKDAFVFTGVPLPDMTRSRVVEVHSFSAKGPIYFHENDPRPVVELKVEGNPYDTEAGKKVIKESVELVRAVLKKEYKPAVATIVQLSKDREEKNEERQIHDCVITGVEMVLDKKEPIKLVFYLLGLLHRPY